MSKFKYFAYGSNLLKERIHLNNPSAEKVSIGRVDEYRLDFNYFSQRWKGAAATIEEDSNNHVWGVIWELDEEHLKTLDEQEGVHQGIYRPVSVTAVTPAGQQLSCRSYQLIAPPEDDRRPSAIYKDVIVRGAAENQLPEEYRHFLAAIEDNGRQHIITLSIRDQDPTVFNATPREPLSPAAYDAASEETLESLYSALEELLESATNEPGVDVELSSGVLTVKLGEAGTYVINKQAPNQQIWLSSPVSGPKRYDFSDDGWVYRRDGLRLHEVLSRELSRLLGTTVDLSSCSHS